jgi:hypothetical protein
MKISKAVGSSPFKVVVVKLSDGIYQGKASGYEVEITEGKYTGTIVKMANGVRGMNIPATITVENGDISITI